MIAKAKGRDSTSGDAIYGTYMEYAVLLPKLRRWHGLYTDRLRPSIVFNFNYKKQKKSKLGTLFSLKFLHHTCSPISLHRRQTCSKLTTCGLVSRRAVSSRKKRIRGSGEPLDHIFVPRPTQPWTKSVPWAHRLFHFGTSQSN